MKQKHILYLAQFYLSENQSGNLRHYYHVQALLKAGFKVSVVSCYLDYMTRDISPEYQGKKVVKELIGENLTIYKTYAYPNYGKSVASRIKNMASYSWNAFLVSLGIKDVDLVIASSTPLLIGLTAFGLKFLKGKKFIFEVRDLWPDTPILMGTLRNKPLIAICKLIEMLSYRNACAIIGLTRGICKGIAEKDIPKNKIFFVPNAADLEIFSQIDQNRTMGIIRESEDEFIITFAGALSLYPNLQNFVKTAKFLKEYKNIKLAIVGEGESRPLLENIKQQFLLDNVVLYGSKPRQDIPNILASSDVCHISLGEGKLFEMFLPIKAFDYMAASRPIIGAIPKSEISEIIKKAECGICVKPNDPESLAQAILEMYKNKDKLVKMGINARKYAEEHFDRAQITNNYIEIINNYI
ncbi:MAG: glycosyltransferase family 4 protein [Candidatus Gastranaerophilales bacterium]|nr:glycosyltransferase family 4 protein [Candidatus Gastranaerophilales bacterium]